MSLEDKQRQQYDQLLTEAYKLRFELNRRKLVVDSPIEQGRLRLDLEQVKDNIESLEKEYRERGWPLPSAQEKPAQQAVASGGDHINAPGAQGIITNPSGPIYMNFSGGPQVDMSRVINNIQPQGDNVMGDKIRIGNITGSIVNVKSTLTNTTQTIGAMPAASADKDELKKLVEQLTTALEGVATPEAEKVAKRVDELVNEAAEKDVDKEAVEAKGNLLLKAAMNIAGAVPTVLTIAQQIISHVSKMIP